MASIRCIVALCLSLCIYFVVEVEMGLLFIMGLWVCLKVEMGLLFVVGLWGVEQPKWEINLDFQTL